MPTRVLVMFSWRLSLCYPASALALRRRQRGAYGWARAAPPRPAGAPGGRPREAQFHANGPGKLHQGAGILGEALAAVAAIAAVEDVQVGRADAGVRGHQRPHGGIVDAQG